MAGRVVPAGSQNGFRDGSGRGGRAVTGCALPARSRRSPFPAIFPMPRAMTGRRPAALLKSGFPLNLRGARIYPAGAASKEPE
ncbi:hypothetical protein Bxe_A1030 [Paraburkholderia xenovorans LB400]|uniref:Uncharacterized protein n=1 Tax=Paraburkholderia xenovorans (strain LB400) TaxID=266265 RepID=Q13VH2_PARXL|nr:hypothetical protein Bxe_A1030 [Paraburkholderia xenovorans LB400]